MNKKGVTKIRLPSGTWLCDFTDALNGTPEALYHNGYVNACKNIANTTYLESVIRRVKRQYGMIPYSSGIKYIHRKDLNRD